MNKAKKTSLNSKNLTPLLGALLVIVCACESGINIGGGKNLNPNAPESGPIEQKSGVKQFRMYRSSVAAIAGLPVSSNRTTCLAEYDEVKASLPSNTNIDSFNVSTVNAATDLARCYGSVFSKNSTLVSRYANININQSPSQALSSVVLDEFIRNLIRASWGPGEENRTDVVNEVKTTAMQLIPLAVDTPAVLNSIFTMVVTIGALRY